jgi:hypothetical protein
MRRGVLSDSYIEEFCKEFRPVPLKDTMILKIEHPQNEYSGIKPIYNQTVVRPSTINTMVANVHRANHKAGDITSDHEELLTGVVEEVIGEREVIEEEVYESPAGRGGARKGSGRMTVGESALKEQIERGLEFKEKIQKRDIQEAIIYSGGDLNEAISRVITDKKQEAVGKVLEGIIKKVEKRSK